VAGTLKELLDGASEFFTAKPERARQTVSVGCELVGVTEVAVKAGKHTLTVDEPKFAGGGDAGASPVNLVLAALAACEAIMYRCFSERLEIPFESLRVEVEGDIDLRGGLACADVSAGFTDVRVIIHLEGPESAERYEELHRVVGSNCPVLDTLTQPVNVSTELQIG
jgi:uncharacterized OsmC-like protein